jgi:phosphomannomutase
VTHLQEEAGPSYYDRRDVRFAPERRAEIMSRFEGEHPGRIAGEQVERVQTLDGYKYFLSDGSWLLVRASGTEPLVRFYTEATSPQMAERVLDAGEELAGLRPG